MRAIAIAICIFAIIMCALRVLIAIHNDESLFVVVFFSILVALNSLSVTFQIIMIIMTR